MKAQEVSLTHCCQRNQNKALCHVALALLTREGLVPRYSQFLFYFYFFLILVVSAKSYWRLVPTFGKIRYLLGFKKIHICYKAHQEC